ncbi:MAG: SIMPL domain-containing protein [Acidobacteriota bacterium]
MKKLFLVLLAVSCLNFVSHAQSVTVQPSVSVVGEAEISVAPNQIGFTFEVVTTDPAIAAAKRANDIASAKTIAVAKSFNIPNDDLQTDRLTIAPRYAGEKDPRGKGTVIGYEVTKRIVVTLKQLERIDEFLAKVIEAGVNRIVDIDIANSELKNYEQQVRLLAVDNARAKADAYAKRLGQKLGRAYVIREESADTPGYTSGFGSGNGDGSGAGDSSPSDLSVPNAFSNAVTFALGKISVSDKLYVTFELLRQ